MRRRAHVEETTRRHDGGHGGGRGRPAGGHARPRRPDRRAPAPPTRSRLRTRANLTDAGGGWRRRAPRAGATPPPPAPPAPRPALPRPVATTGRETLLLSAVAAGAWLAWAWG